MDYLKLTFLCIFGAVACASVISRKGYHCMFPTQWQSKVFMDVGAMIRITEQMNASGTYFFDHPNQQMRLDIDGLALGNYHFSFTYIWKLLEKEVFTIDNNNKTCSRESDAIEVWDQWAGIPEDAVGVTFGWLDRFKLTVSRYTLVRNGGDTDALITMDVKADTICTPIRVTFQDAHLDPMAGEMVNYEFLDVKPLSDPAVFNTPTNCSNDTSQENEWVRRLLPSRRIGLFLG